MQRKWQMTLLNSAEVLGHFVGFVAQGCWKCCFLLRPQWHWHFLHFLSPERRYKTPPLLNRLCFTSSCRFSWLMLWLLSVEWTTPQGQTGHFPPTKRSTGGPYGRFRLRTFNCTCVACMHCWHWGGRTASGTSVTCDFHYTNVVPDMHDWTCLWNSKRDVKHV